MTNSVMRVDGVASAHDLTRASSRRTPLRRIAAAPYIRDTHSQPCASKTLAKLASVGGGPAYRKAGKYPLYEPDDLDKWARARLSPKVLRSFELTAKRRQARQRGAPRTDRGAHND